MAYGAGRLAAGFALFLAPARAGGVMIKEEAGRPGARAMVRAYGTRELLLGGGTIFSAATGRDASTWVAAGAAADVLDGILQAIEWKDLPHDRRGPAMVAAVGATAAGLWVLASRR